MRVLFIFFLLHPLGIFAQRFSRMSLVLQDNEFNQSVDSSSYHFNLLSLNGKPLDYNTFTIYLRGTLQLIRETSEWVKAVPVAFHAYVRRAYKIIARTDQPFYELDLNLILPKAKPGDQLIIEPANDEDWKSKRILKLIL